MRHLFNSLWRDEAGFIVSAELVLVASILVIGLIVGLASVQEAVIGEYQDVAGALRAIDQSYGYNGMHGCPCTPCGFSSWTAGSSYSVGGPALPVCFDYAVPSAGECLTAPAVIAPPVPVPGCELDPVPLCPGDPRLPVLPPGPCATDGPAPPTEGMVSPLEPKDQ